VEVVVEVVVAEVVEVEVKVEVVEVKVEVKVEVVEWRAPRRTAVLAMIVVSMKTMSGTKGA